MILSRFLRRRFSRTRFRWSDHPHRALFCQRRPLRRGFDSRRHNWSNHWGRRWASWSHAHCRGLRTVTVRSCRPARRTVRSAGRACRIRGVGCVHRNIFLRRPMQKRQLILVPRAHTRNDHHRQHHSTNHKLLLPYALPLRPVNTKRIVRIHMFRRTRKIQRRLRQQILQRINLFFSRGNGLLRHPRRGGRRRRFTHPHDWQLHPNRRRRDAALCPLLCLNFGCRPSSALLLPLFAWPLFPPPTAPLLPPQPISAPPLPYRPALAFPAIPATAPSAPPLHPSTASRPHSSAQPPARFDRLPSSLPLPPLRPWGERARHPPARETTRPKNSLPAP